MTDMTDMTDNMVSDRSEEFSSQRYSVARAADNRADLFTPSVLDAAAVALTAVQKALSEHEIATSHHFQAYSDHFASKILSACEDRFTAEFLELDEDVDPVALLEVATAAAAKHLGRKLEPVEGPALAPEGRAVFGYVMLPRQTGSPARDTEGHTPLVLSLGRPDQHMLRIAYSSGSGWDGPYDPGPWCWYLGHERPKNVCITETRIIGRAPTPEVATEVGIIAAQVLTGEQELRH